MGKEPKCIVGCGETGVNFFSRLEKCLQATHMSYVTANQAMQRKALGILLSLVSDLTMTIYFTASFLYRTVTWLKSLVFRVLI